MASHRKGLDELRHRLEALKRFRSSINELVRQIIDDLDYVLIDLNVQSQLYELGIDSEGTSLMSFAPYSPMTRKMKFLKHQPTDRVTLYDMGDFHRSFRVVTTAESFVIEATDIKTERLQFKYGDAIIGLTDENMSMFMQEYMYPELARILQEWLEG